MLRCYAMLRYAALRYALMMRLLYDYYAIKALLLR